MNVATQDASDVSRKAMIGGGGLGRTGRLLGLLSSMSHESGGVTVEGAVLRRSRQGRSLTRIRGRWKEGHISGAGVVLMDLDNTQVVSQTEIMEIQTPSQIWSRWSRSWRWLGVAQDDGLRLGTDLIPQRLIGLGNSHPLITGHHSFRRSSCRLGDTRRSSKG